MKILVTATQISYFIIQENENQTEMAKNFLGSDVRKCVVVTRNIFLKTRKYFSFHDIISQMKNPYCQHILIQITMVIKAVGTNVYWLYLSLEGYVTIVQGRPNSRSNSPRLVTFISGQVIFTDYQLKWANAMGKCYSCLELVILITNKLIRSHCFLNHLPNQAFTASSAATGWFGRRFKNT